MPEAAEYGDVIINDVHYKIKGKLERALSSVYPQKIVIGDSNQDSNPVASVITWTDFGGGITNKPIYIGRENQVLDEVASAFGHISSPGHFVHPGRAFQTAAGAASNVGAIGELASEIYAAFGTSIRKYNNGTDSWGSQLDVLPAAATDAITVRLSNVVYQIFATGGGYSYSSNGTSWTDDTTDTQYMCWWDERLWGIDSTGQLWFSFAIGTETNAGQLPLPNSSVTKLFTGPDAAGNEIIYAATLYGLYAYDAEGQKFVETRMRLPRHPQNCLGCCTWGAYIYVSAGPNVWEYRPQEGIARTIGPLYSDATTGPAVGPIRFLVPSHTGLIAINDTPDGNLLMWDGKGWALGASIGFGPVGVAAALVSTAYSIYRGWFALGQRVYRVTLRATTALPTDISGFDFEANGTLDLPWLIVGAQAVDALAMELEVETKNPTSSESIEAGYYLNYATSPYTMLGSLITTTGLTIFKFPNSSLPAGTAFRAIRFAFTLLRGTTTTNSADIKSVTFRFRKKLRPKWRYTMVLDLTDDYGGNTPQQQQTALIAALGSNLLITIGYKEGVVADWVDKYVDVLDLKMIEGTGPDYRALCQIVVAEP